MSNKLKQAQELLCNIFGYTTFRGQQAAIIEQLIAGQNALVIMPTGAGKSLCYQIPALVRPGVGVIVSPLIALMQDQVSALKELNIKATFLNSTLDFDSLREVEEQVRNQKIDLLYLAPERLLQPHTLNLLKQSNIALFAIDEAHCVSQWGHDFRPEYIQLSALAEHFPSIPRIALTATADKPTRDEIVERLSLQDAPKFVGGFDRPNIQYHISQHDKPREALWYFLEQEHPKDVGIIYCLSRKKVDATAEWLSKKGRTALPYHAGLSANLRAHHQARFLKEDNIIIIATIAFGMGIDKPDVRFVAHLDLPKSIEAYYQETGRAGRDGLPSNAWMSYSLQNVISLRQMIENSDAHDSQKNLERRKLDAMLGLCEITSCRRQALIAYFNDNLDQACGNCDNCLIPPDTWDGTEATRMAMSTIYRTGQRFGVNYLVDVLIGTDSERIRQLEHHQLSVYGIGKKLDPSEWRSVFRQLIVRQLIGVDIQGYGGLFLNEESRPILKGEQKIDLRREHKITQIKKKKSHSRFTDDADIELWEDLRALRRELAEEHNVPPYVIFHDATLAEMVIWRPEDNASLLRIDGVGQAKLERYGSEVLALIQNTVSTPH